MKTQDNIRGRLGSKDVAGYMGVTSRELKELRKRRALAFYRIGHRTVTYAIADLDAFLAKCRVAPAGEQIGGAT